MNIIWMFDEYLLLVWEAIYIRARVPRTIIWKFCEYNLMSIIWKFVEYLLLLWETIQYTYIHARAIIWKFCEFDLMIIYNQKYM